MRIKIISWNIWKGKNLDRIIDFLERENADIIGLQEVIEKDAVKGGINIGSFIADKLGYFLTYCKAFTTDRHVPVFDIGNATLSRIKPLKSKCIFLSGIEEYKGDSQTEPRIAVETQFSIGGKSLTVFNTHLSYSDKLAVSNIRKKQTEKLIGLLKSQNTILLGDFNAAPESPEVKSIAKILKNADQGSFLPTWSVYPADYKGFKVDGLKYRIDHMFMGRGVKIRKFWLGKSGASDHLPLLAETEI
ncbi:endonuclease/exonuclease/phosphatase family protein [Patescibacteria group bacterium]|nr:endonuclease/exonuclease/phosphatase family protein [Patescibacteria group bacterium]